MVNKQWALETGYLEKYWKQRRIRVAILRQRDPAYEHKNPSKYQARVFLLFDERSEWGGKVLSLALSFLLLSKGKEMENEVLPISNCYNMVTHTPYREFLTAQLQSQTSTLQHFA